MSRRRGSVRLSLDEIETAVLASLLNDFADVMAGDALDHDDEVRARLFPSAYPGDDAASDEYRDMTESSLRTERAGRARECAVQLGEGSDVQLDAESADRWIRVLNDLRLTLGTRLGVTEDDHGADIDEDDPEAQQWAVYHWLTGVQDLLVHALMR